MGDLTFAFEAYSIGHEFSFEFKKVSHEKIMSFDLFLTNRHLGSSTNLFIKLEFLRRKEDLSILDALSPTNLGEID